jgi:uncharacterized membrane protein
MQVISHHKHAVNITEPERWASIIGGGLLTVAGLNTGLKKKSPVGAAMLLVGGDLVRRGITGHSRLYEAVGIRTAPKGQGTSISVPYELGIRVDRAVTINCPRAQVFRFFRDFSNLPRFMKHVKSVRDDGGNRSHWVVKAPAGRTVEWDAMIHNEFENEMIAWRTLPGAHVDHAGSVWFKDAPGGRGTELKVELQYNPPAGALGAVLSKLWGEEPSQQIEADLHSLKQILEAGEILTTEGQPRGRKTATRETKKLKEWQVESASEDSFPASDPPAWTHEEVV